MKTFLVRGATLKLYKYTRNATRDSGSLLDHTYVKTNNIKSLIWVLIILVMTLSQSTWHNNVKI